MNIYLLTQNEHNSYDTYDSMVIAADNEEDAKHLSFVQSCAYTNRCHHGNTTEKPVWRHYYAYTSYYNYDDWSKNPTIELIATNALVEEGVVCASFNAG